MKIWTLIIRLVSNVLSIKYFTCYNLITEGVIAFGVILLTVLISAGYYSYKRRKYSKNYNNTNVSREDPPTISDLFLYIPNIIIVFIMIVFVMSLLHLKYTSFILTLLRIMNNMIPLCALWISEYIIYCKHSFKGNKKSSHIVCYRWILGVVWVSTTLLFMFGVQP